MILLWCSVVDMMANAELGCDSLVVFVSGGGLETVAVKERLMVER